MSELSKYEVLLNDLSSIQVQAAIITNKCKDLTQRNKELEELLVEAKKEKTNENCLYRPKRSCRQGIGQAGSYPFRVRRNKLRRNQESSQKSIS